MELKIMTLPAQIASLVSTYWIRTYFIAVRRVRRLDVVPVYDKHSHRANGG